MNQFQCGLAHPPRQQHGTHLNTYLREKSISERKKVYSRNGFPRNVSQFLKINISFVPPFYVCFCWILSKHTAIITFRFLSINYVVSVLTISFFNSQKEMSVF